MSDGGGSAGHDQRDLDFAKKYNLDILPVVKPFDHEGEFIIKDNSMINQSISVLHFRQDESSLESVSGARIRQSC